jgi:hypothetical protein
MEGKNFVGSFLKRITPIPYLKGSFVFKYLKNNQTIFFGNYDAKLLE